MRLSGRTRAGERGWWLRLAPALGLVVVLAACADEAADDEQPEDDDATEVEDAEEEPDDADVDESADELRVVLPREPATLDPVHAVVSDATVFGAFLEPLIRPDAGMEPTSEGLIVDWEQVDDVTWHFEVREGVEFHNGEPFNADAVAWNILNNRDSEGILTQYFGPIAEAVALDETTVEVITNEPNNSLVPLFMIIHAIPPDYYEEVGSEGFDEAPVGTGPYVYDGRELGQSMTAVANPDYWDGEVGVERITWNFTADASTRANLLVTDAVDVEFDVAFEALDTLLEAEEVGVEPYEDSLEKVSLFVTANQPPMDDRDLREAVARAIDYDLIVAELFEGEGVERSRNLLDTGAAGATEEHGYDYSPEEAEQLVAQYDGDPTVQLSPITDRGPRGEEVGEALASMLENVGFQVERNPLPYGDFVELALTQNLPGVYMHPKTSLAPDPFFWASGFLTSFSLTKHCSEGLYDEYDALAAEALAQPSAGEAAAVYTELDELALTQDVCVIPLYNVVKHWASSVPVDGLEMRSDGIPVTFADLEVQR